MFSYRVSFHEDPVGYFDQQSDAKKREIAFRVFKKLFSADCRAALERDLGRSPSVKELNDVVLLTVDNLIETEPLFFEGVRNALAEYNAIIKGEERDTLSP